MQRRAERKKFEQTDMVFASLSRTNQKAKQNRVKIYVDGCILSLLVTYKPVMALQIRRNKLFLVSIRTNRFGKFRELPASEGYLSIMHNANVTCQMPYLKLNSVFTNVTGFENQYRLNTFQIYVLANSSPVNYKFADDQPL